jgi:hypothetical protein
MWLLVVAICLAGPNGPLCSSSLSGVVYPEFAACEDAAMRGDDRMRTRAAQNGDIVLVIDTRCLLLSSGGPST